MPRPEVASMKKPVVTTTVATMKSDELVNDRSSPPTSSGTIFWIWN